jgi:hypothetical protein
VTLYAAGRCAREAWPAAASELLTTLLASAPKVGARKQAARLLTELRLPVAVDALLAALNRSDEHRDVRAAVLAALRDWLDDERVWPVLAANTISDRHLAGALLGAKPAALAEAHRPRYAELITRLARHPEPQVSARALTALPGWATWPAGMAEAVIAAAVTGGPEAWPVAVDLAAEPGMLRAIPDLPVHVVAALLDGADHEPDAAATADRPGRQRLDRLVGSLRGSVAVARHARAPARRCAELLGVVQSGGQVSGWAEPWRDRLRALRRHPDVEVQVAALAVVTATEFARPPRPRRR